MDEFGKLLEAIWRDHWIMSGEAAFLWGHGAAANRAQLSRACRSCRILHPTTFCKSMSHKELRTKNCVRA